MMFDTGGTSFLAVTPRVIHTGPHRTTPAERQAHVRTLREAGFNDRYTFRISERAKAERKAATIERATGVPMSVCEMMYL